MKRMDGSPHEPIALTLPIEPNLLKARAPHLEDEQRRERILPFEYLQPPWLRPARPALRPVVQDDRR